MSDIILDIKNLSISVGSTQIIDSFSIDFYKKKITAIMGPSGCGKTTLIRSINRMHDLSGEYQINGSINYNKQDLMKMNPILVRQQIGMVFQRPNPFPTMSIYDNVIAGYILNGIKLEKDKKDDIVLNCLTKVALYDNKRNLIGVATMANPVRKTEDRQYLFKLKLDL